MFQRNVDELLAKLAPTDLVLDVGGWACPFNRANVVLDAEPFDTRGYYKNIGREAFQGGDKEHFTRETWIRRDICGREPWPFADKQFDFAICSHVLEDIRDPLFVCSELVRVAKRGYIEVPSREWETCRGAEAPSQVGLSHHRWLIDFSDRRIDFLQKFHMIHAHWRFSFPQSHLLAMPAEKAVQWLWWDGRFEFGERTIHGLDNIAADLAGFVQKIRPYPAWKLRAATWTDKIASKMRNAVGRLARIGSRG